MTSSNCTFPVIYGFCCLPYLHNFSQRSVISLLAWNAIMGLKCNNAATSRPVLLYTMEIVCILEYGASLEWKKFQIYRIFVKTLSKCEILSPRAIYCITLLDYEIGLVKYVCHFTFVLRTITYRSSLKLNFHRLKRNCAHSRAKYLGYVFAIFTTLSADIP